jgi:hypothetical protein
MTKSYFHLQGTQYAYKIKYDDVSNLFLLEKPDGGRMLFVIGLEKPIRQKAQKYEHLVIETHKIDQTLSINLTEEEIAKDYDGQLELSMTLPTSSLIAKLFKVLSGKKVSPFLSFQNLSSLYRF